MKIVCVGGGAAGLYFAILMKRAYPDCDLTLLERNRPDDAFGWGVVFSSETLSHFQESDPESYGEIERSFRYWDNIDTFYRGSCVTSTGHAFCGLSRKVLLNILQRRAQSLGVKLQFQTDVSDVTPYLSADLVVGADGLNSRVREQFADHFQPRIELGKGRFTWLGTTLPLAAFTFFYRDSPHGLFQVHAYPFQSDLSTFIVECHEEVWRRAGLDCATQEETVAFCEKLFADELQGHRLLTNRSIWRTFPTIECQHWHHQNIVLLGDAVHTAHFSIGSGTKLAMEDAIALVAAFQQRGPLTRSEVPQVLSAYEDSRRIEALKIQRSAATSMAWFENSARYQSQHPVQFTFNQTTRSLRISWDNLAKRDPAFVDRVAAWYADDQGAPRNSDGSVPVPMFTPFRLRELTLENRVVVSPMCMYSAKDGLVSDWHLVHLGSRAVGGAGLVITEMTDVSAIGRISPGCAGMYRPEHRDSWRRIVDFVHQHSGAKIALQLGHAGRKGSTRLAWEGMDQPLLDGNWPIIAPSPLPYLPHSQVPRPMERSDLEQVQGEFVQAARWADEAGFDMLELHMAHGYLLASFISPLTNRRQDEWGGSLENRMRFPLAVLDAVRAVWPAQKPISVRISATDWAPGGLTGDDAVEVARLLQQHAADIIDVSTGQTVKEAQPVYGRMYQVPFADQIRNEVRIPTMAVGNLLSGDHCNTILAAGRADLCVLARQHLRDPNFTQHEAQRYHFYDLPYPPPYGAVKPSPPIVTGAPKAAG